MAQYLMAVSVRTPEGGVTFPFDKGALIQTIHAARDVSIRGWVEEMGRKKKPILVMRGAESRVWSHEEFERERAEYLIAHGNQGFGQACARMNEERMEKRRRLHHFLDTVTKANEPTVLAEGSFEELSALSHQLHTDFDGIQRQLLGDEELKFLMVRRGNLDERERKEIESHVTHTYKFLEQIPWTRELRNIPKIAYGHHEKLNGRGYPRAIGADDIPVQTRMMTISDIFDALTASDRPYKRAVPIERALDILHVEAKEGMLDPALLKTFVEAKVFEVLPD
jgi:hypothetical protein